jgi:hypothetical protein
MARVDKVKLNIPKKCLLQITDILTREESWMFGSDKPGNTNKKYLNNLIEGKAVDFGFTLATFDASREFVQKGNNLNVYADLIFQMIVEKILYLKDKKIFRIYWNYYHQNSQTNFHRDNDHKDFYSIVYNLHSNDGGTEILLNDESNFYKSEENEAIIFKSTEEHRGVAPKTDPTRFSLNIVVY